MKKFAHIAGALLLATSSLSAVSAFAANAPTAQTMSTTIASTAKSVEASLRAKGVTDDAKISQAIASATANLIQSFIASGASAADINAAMSSALSASGLSPDAAAGLGTVNSELASLESSGPAAFGRGGGQNGQGQNGGGHSSPPPPPPPASSGSGYQGNQGNQNNQGNSNGQ
jgi:hypothetical protein